MFYNHEVLTSRQHGVATIWLVATLGSKSALRKVTRKAILNVDVPKACNTIIDPAAPMALRLQSNLLYGVSRVYSQQCAYLLHDVEATRDRWRQISRIVKDTAVDPSAGKARREQLTIPDDPTFNIDLAFDFDLGAFDEPSYTQASSFLSLPSFSSASSGHVQPQLALQSSETPPAGGVETGYPGDTSSALRIASRAGPASVLEDSGLLPDPGFYFDEEGNEIQRSATRVSRMPSSVPRAESRAESESVIARRVHDEHQAGLQAAAAELDDVLPLDDGVLAIGDDILPDAEPFPRPTEQHRFSSDRPDEEQNEDEESAAIPQRRRRAKPLIIDDRAELLNRDLAQWNSNYLENMAEARRVKQAHKAIAQAKKNAAWLVFGRGIGDVGIGLGRERVPGPLDEFSGDRLMALVSGQEVGRKRRRAATASDEESDDGRRRVRAKDGDEEQEVGRGDEQDLMMDEGIGIGDAFDDVELPRAAPPSLPDLPSSQMPWNISARAARAGSGLPAARPGLSGNISSALGAPVQPLGGRHRISSASPLLGRGVHRLSSLELPGGGDLGTDVDISGLSEEGDEGINLSRPPSDDPFALHSPRPTGTQQETQWAQVILDTESNNFYQFLQQQAANGAGEAVFEELLPPMEYSKNVGAQAILHVLSLATKGLIRVEQEEAFGPIVMVVV